MERFHRCVRPSSAAFSAGGAAASAQLGDEAAAEPEDVPVLSACAVFTVPYDITPSQW